MNSIVTMSFISDLVNYINNKFEADDRLPSSRKPFGYSAFERKIIKDTNKPYYVVQVIDNSPRDETFIDVSTLNVGVQIDVYALKGTFDKNEYFADVMASIYQDLISGYMTELKYSGQNKNIRLMRKVSGTPSFPFEDGAKAYYATLRYDFTIMNKYTKIYNN